MKSNRTVLENNASLATLDENEDWVRTNARELDFNHEMDIAWALCRIMIHFQRSYNFAGVSSNNIFWEMTDTPVRMICIPLNKTYVTVINPKYERLAGQSVSSTERCGSIPNYSCVVKRKTLVAISGYNMDGDFIELEYGSKRGRGPNCDSWIIQHEMDHVDGVLIKDKSIF